MLFLLRPRQTVMPYSLPRSRLLVEERNRQLQQAYDATRRVAPQPPAATPTGGTNRDVVDDLKAAAELHRSGALTDAEFTAAKARILRDQEKAG